MRCSSFLVLCIFAALVPGVFVSAMSDAALEGNMVFAGGAAFMLLPLGLRPREHEGAPAAPSGRNDAAPAQQPELRQACEGDLSPERRNLHAVLEGCPVGAAVVAHGRLCFANALFVENTRLATGAEGLRIAFDKLPSEAGHADASGRNAMLFWKAVDGNEHRMRLIACMGPYGGEEAFFLWMTRLLDDAIRHALWHLPVSCRPEPEPLPFSPSPAAVASSGISRGRILLAEDNEINQEIALALLADAGVEVEVASNGQEAVDLFLRKDFDLILMDIQMPLMDGTDATRAIRTSGKAGAGTVPILAMTAHATNSDREKSLHAGMNDHLTKPINPQRLYAALDIWLPGRMRAPAGKAASAPDPVLDPPSAVSAPQETGGRLSVSQAAASAETPRQDMLFRLQGIDAQAGLSNVAGNRELYLRLLDRFARHYRNSGMELRDALQRMEHDASAHEEAVRLAHTAKGVAANLGGRALAAVAAELESAIKKNEVREEMLARYDLLLSEALDSIESLPKRDDVHVGQKAVPAADKEHIAAVLGALPALMQTDWYGAQQQLLALAPAVEGTVASAHFREITAALEEFDSEEVAEKGKRLLAVM